MFLSPLQKHAQSTENVLSSNFYRKVNAFAVQKTEPENIDVSHKSIV
jgi:hypothetical protein